MEVPPEPERRKPAETEPTQGEPATFAEDLTPPFQELETPSEILSEARAEQGEPADAPGEERRGRRHRSRRRRSPGEEPARSVETAERSQPAEAAPRREPEEDAAGGRRPKHRRRRRGSDRKRGTGEQPKEVFQEGRKPADDEIAAARELPEDTDEDTDLAEVVAEDADAAEGQEDNTGDRVAASDKASHRAIPSWGEAINYIVSVNLEARAKNPDRRSPSRSRGHRGHGRERPSGRGAD